MTEQFVSKLIHLNIFSCLIAYSLFCFHIILMINMHIPELNLYICCQMLFFPEACDYIADSKSQTVEMAESLNGDIMKRYCRAAQESGIWLSIGGFHQKV